MEAIIVPCTRQKVWDARPNAGPTQARDAYTGSAFMRWRAYAEDSGWPWYILSTRYGLTPPDQPITNYNVTISEAESDPEFLQTLKVQVRSLGIDEFDRILVLDWERFQTLIEQALTGARTRVVLHRILY